MIFVTSVEGPLSETEQALLYDVRDQVRKLFVVVNKMDLLAPAERETVLGYVRAGVRTALGTGEQVLYGVSARQALQAKQQGDAEALQQSGLPSLESALALFLAREQGRAFLVAILDRALTVLTAMPEEPPAEGETGVAALRQTLQALRATLLGTPGAVEAPARDAAPHPDFRVLERALAASRADRAGRTPAGATCVLCSVQPDRLFDFFATWQHVLAMSPAAQRAFTAAHGFCLLHTWQFRQIASPRA